MRTNRLRMKRSRNIIIRTTEGRRSGAALFVCWHALVNALIRVVCRLVLQPNPGVCGCGHNAILSYRRCVRFGRASQHAQSPPRGDRPSSGQVSRMRKTAVCGRGHVAHDNRCLPGEGRQVKTWLLTRRRGWRAAPTRGTRARFCEPARPLGTVSHAQRRHPISRRRQWPVG